MEAKNENRGVASVSWLRDVTVEVYGHRVMLPKGSFGTVQVKIFGTFYIMNYCNIGLVCACWANAKVFIQVIWLHLKSLKPFFDCLGRVV